METKRAYSDEELTELVRTVRTARSSPRGPVLARVLFVLTALGPLVVLGFLVALLVRPPRVMVPWWPHMVGTIVLFIAALVACVWVRRRFKLRVLEREGKVCPNCHYDLRSVEDVGDVQFCPECREPFRFAELRRVWAGWSPSMVWWD